MFNRVLIPVDLSHVERLGKALRVAGDFAKLHDAELHFVAVTAATPGPLAHNPEEFAAKLDDFAQEQGRAYGVPASSRAYTSHDPATDLDRTLLRAVEDSGADFVVMASHVPGLPEHLFASHGGKLASHAKASVLLVR